MEDAGQQRNNLCHADEPHARVQLWPFLLLPGCTAHGATVLAITYYVICPSPVREGGQVQRTHTNNIAACSPWSLR